MVQATILFMAGLILICIGGDRLVDAAVAIARKLGIPQIVVGATIVSLGTTLPEVLVSTTAAFDGSAAIAAGNAFGSIICNTALIAGLTQTIRPTKKVEASSLLWRSGFFFAVLIAMNVYGYVTGSYGRPVGIMLLLLFALYAYLNIRRSASEGEDSQEEEKDQEVSVPRQLLVLVICAGLLYLGANLLVDNGIYIANAIGVPERVIKRARDILAELEAGEIGKPVAEKPREDQISLGDLGGELVLKKLRMTDVNTLTPLMALNLVEEWKKDLG